MAMTETYPTKNTGISWFQLFKYCVYGLLTINAVLFFQENYLAASHVFTDGVTFGQLIEAYADTIDTCSWIILLLIFELETHVIEDDKLQGGLRWLLSGFKLLCYAVIAYAVYGYFSKYVAVHGFETSALTNLCQPMGQSLSFMTTLDEYEVVNTANCAQLSSASSFMQIPNTMIVTDAEVMAEAQWLALIDVVNSFDWLLVVLILGADVWLQLKGQLTDKLIKISASVKAVLYSVLLVCAVLWGIDGDFLDFWDAFLWIVAFIFIEMNLFEWHAEEVAEAA